jgi:hypothetical protein
MMVSLRLSCKQPPLYIGSFLNSRHAINISMRASDPCPIHQISSSILLFNFCHVSNHQNRKFRRSSRYKLSSAAHEEMKIKGDQAPQTPAIGGGIVCLKKSTRKTFEVQGDPNRWLIQRSRPIAIHIVITRGMFRVDITCRKSRRRQENKWCTSQAVCAKGRRICYAC